jgi:hypothetical protein
MDGSGDETGLRRANAGNHEQIRHRRAHARLHGGGMSRPQGVRIVHANGAVTLCEIVPSHVAYIDGEDIEIWAVATPLRPGDSIDWDDMPPGTGITGPTEAVAS